MNVIRLPTLLFVPLLGACLTLGSLSVAAAPPPTLGGGGAGPEQEACAGRSLGDACTLPNRQLGTCGEGTCNRLDYSGGSPPKAIEEPCVVCKPGGDGQPGGDGHEGSPALGSGAAPGDSGGAGDDGDASASGTNAKEPPQSSSRCRVGEDTGSPAGLAMLALLGLALRRRRARP